MTTPQPGDFGLAPIPGWDGKFINLGQRLIGCPSHYQHAFLVLPGGQLIQAEPGGAVVRPLSIYDGKNVTYSALSLSDEQRNAIVFAGLAYKGVPYSFADYLSLALHRWHVPSSALHSYVHSTKHMICSQLVAQAYADAGVSLATSLNPQDIAPGDLAALIHAG